MDLLRLVLAVVDSVREYLVGPRVLEVHLYHHEVPGPLDPVTTFAPYEDGARG